MVMDSSTGMQMHVVWESVKSLLRYLFVVVVEQICKMIEFSEFYLKVISLIFLMSFDCHDWFVLNSEMKCCSSLSEGMIRRKMCLYIRWEEWSYLLSVITFNLSFVWFIPLLFFVVAFQIWCKNEKVIFWPRIEWMFGGFTCVFINGW